MENKFIVVSQTDGIATIQLNRPDKRNAMHGALVTELLHAVQALSEDASRVLMFTGSGDHFCAGGDIAWMKEMAMADGDINAEDTQLLADLLFQLYSYPKPTIVLAQGATRGGGLGLLAACDIAIAAKDASFALPEVKIGITPSIVSPYVMTAIGERAAHYYFLTGENFDADKAMHLGLIHQITERAALMSVGMMLAKSMLQSSPQALTAAKRLIRHVANEKITPSLAQKTAEHLADLRVTKEAKEGLQAFVEKRLPHWS